jgi:uncharacterized SAM-binding protein YcdF (DUF218 family)
MIGGHILKSKFRRITGKALFVIAALCFINSLSTLIYKNSFWSFFLLLGLMFGMLGYLYLYVKFNTDSKFIKISLWVFHGIAALFILSFFIAEVLIIGSGSKKEADTPDYVVILGAGLWGDTPSLTLAQRLDSSLDLIKVVAGNTKIVVSGGQGPGETISEAEAMKKYLIDRGISEDRIIKEDKSTSTQENLIYTRKLLREIDSRENIRVTIVTSNFHMYRSKVLARNAGFEEVQCWSAPITPYLIPTYYIREYMAVIKSLVIDRLI